MEIEGEFMGCVTLRDYLEIVEFLVGSLYQVNDLSTVKNLPAFPTKPRSSTTTSYIPPGLMPGLTRER